MADKKISELDAITGANTAADDYFVVVDTSGSVTKKISRAELNNAIEQDVLSTVDINGGTIDNTVIGGTTPAAGSFTNVTVSGTVDGRDVAADGTKLDGIEASADVTDATNVAAAGALMTSGGTVTGDINFGDGDKSVFGAGSDLEIFHDGSDSWISDAAGLGNLYIRSNDLIIMNAPNNETLLRASQDGAVTAYYNGSEKIATTNTGVDVTGAITTDAITETSAGKVGIGTASPPQKFVVSNAGADNIVMSENSSASIQMFMQATSGTGSVGTLTNHDVQFLANNSEKMRLTSAGSLGIGTTTPNAASKLHVSGGRSYFASNSNPYATYLRYNDSTAGAFVGSPSANAFQVSTSSGASRFNIDGDGNIGIKTTAQALDTSLAGLSIASGGTVVQVHNGNGSTLKLSDPATGANRGFAFSLQGTEAVISNCESGPLRFGTGNAERMRINSNGSLGVGSTLTTAGVVIEAQGTNGWNLNTVVATTAGIGHIVFSNGNGVVGSIVTSGTATAYNTASDYRLKENVTAITSATDRLNQLNPVRFNFIADADTTVDGFIAHEVATVIPEAISGEKDAVDADGNAVMQGIDQSKLVPLLTAALQEALTKIDQLETRITALEA